MATNNAINAPFPLTVPQGGTGLATLTSHGFLIGNGAGNISPTAEPSNGQLPIGSTGNAPQLATLTAGSGISITNGAGSITIAATGNKTWTTVTGATQAMAVNNGYVANSASSLLVFTLPATAVVGDEVEVDGLGAGSWQIAQNAGQLIHFGNQVTTTGTGGSLQATNQYDCVGIRCIVANTTWTVFRVQGNLTVV